MARACAKAHRRPDRTKDGTYMADLFSGCGKVGRAVSSYGFSVKAWDIIHGPNHDITDPTVLRRLLSDIRDRKVFAAMIALPCTSLTIARDRTFLIRSRTQPWGADLTNATDRDRAALQTGNKFLTLRVSPPAHPETTLGGLLEASWGLLGASWSLMAASWGPLGGLLGASWGHLGAILAPLGASWAPLGAILEAIDQKRGVPQLASPFQSL